MGFFGKIYNMLTGNPVIEDVKIENADNKRPLAAPTIHADLKPQTMVIEKPVKISENLKNFIEEFLKTGNIDSDCLFFDPEEFSFYVYRIEEKMAENIFKIPISNWEDLLNEIKRINNKTIEIKDKIYHLFVSISFTNLGERAAIILNEPGISNDEIKDKKKFIIKILNKQKPATALTNENIENLLKTVKKTKKKKIEDFIKILTENKVLAQEEIKNPDFKNDIQTILSKPIPRKQIVSAFAKWLGIEYFDVELNRIDRDLTQKIPEKTAKELKIVVVKDGERIEAAFADPLNREALKTAKEIFGKKIKILMSSEEDIRHELEKTFKSLNKER